MMHTTEDDAFRREKLPSLTYCPHIDGLRAVAVLAVLIFHTFPHYMPGGFMGVDIFFVISGFLISRILLTNIHNQNFSFFDFYRKRILRIFPALITIFLFCLWVGWAYFLSDELTRFGKQLGYSSLSIANILFNREAAYFDTDTNLKPLLHVWSLAIEEQFYLLWPLLLFALYRTRCILWGTLLLVALSFYMNIAESYSNENRAFYLLPYRFWELALGGILAYATLFPKRILHTIGGTSLFIQDISKKFSSLLPAGHSLCSPTPLARSALSPREENLPVYKSGNSTTSAPHAFTLRLFTPYAQLLKNVLSVTGLVLILYSLFIVKKEGVVFPGWIALLPTLGTTLMIAGGRTAWMSRNILSHKILLFIGLISYPLYLWHWPLLVFNRMLHTSPPPLESPCLPSPLFYFCMAYLPIC